MIISSTLLALNLETNFKEVTNAAYSLICISDDLVDFAFIGEINANLIRKDLKEVLPISYERKLLAFCAVFDHWKTLEKGLNIIKRTLWENGFLLSTKIVLTHPEIRLLKDYGEGI